MKLIFRKSYNFLDEEIKHLENLGYNIGYYSEEVSSSDVFVGTYEKEMNISNLKFIQSTIVGFDSIDLEYLKSKNIVFANASGMSSGPIAEYVVLKILEHYKDSRRFHIQQANKEWKDFKANYSGIEELEDKVVMILNTGNIGKAIAKRLRAFNMKIIGINSDGRDIDGFDEVYSLDNVYSHLKDVDVVVGALPLNTKTTNLYDEKFFKAMNNSAIFINVGRGKQVDEAAALDAAGNYISHMYLDVVVEEPLPRDSKLWIHPHISITPHISAGGNLVNDRLKKIIIENLERFIKGEPLINQVI